MTLFFSFYYSQYHFYPIAQFKDRVGRGDIPNPAAPSFHSSLTCQVNLWSTANNVMQMRPANANHYGVAIVRIIPGIRISGSNERVGIGA